MSELLSAAQQQPRIETYTPLYRKYRPQSFADVVGQQPIVQTLGNAIEHNRVAHAYLFCGPRGTGKTSAARIFAKSLNCEQGPTITPCMQCASCTGIAAGNALDVIEFDAASNNGVSDARELIENCQYSSMNGRFKVYIVDEVHMLTPQAFNALLKTLEEPPANVIFIFATTEAHKVLPTIVSRCQRFDFSRITTQDIVLRLQSIADAESIKIEDEALRLIARHSRGGLRDAVGLLDQVSVLSRSDANHPTVQRPDVAMFIGALEEDLLLALSDAIAQKKASELLEKLEELANRGVEPIQLLKDLTLHFRHLLVLQSVGPNTSADSLDLAAEYVAELRKQLSLFPHAEELPQILARLAIVERNVRHTSQPQLWLEVGLMELVYRHNIAVVQELSERIEKLEALLSGQAGSLHLPAAPQKQHSPVAPSRSTTQRAATPLPAPPAKSAPTNTAPQTSVASSSAQSISASAPSNAPPTATIAAGTSSLSEADYAQICAMIPSLGVRSLLQQQTFPLSFNDNNLVIGVLSEPNLVTLKAPNRFIHLEKTVEKFFGRPIKVELVHEKTRPAGSAAPVIPAAPKAANPAPAFSSKPQMSSQRSEETATYAAPSSQTTATPILKSPALPLPALNETPVAAPVLAPGSRPPAMEAIRNSVPIDFSAPPSMATASSSGSQVSMAELEGEPPLFNPASNAKPDFDSMPPMEDDGPMDAYDNQPLDGDSVFEALSTTPVGNQSAMQSGDSREAIPADALLKEAQQHALQLLQGKVL